MALKLIPTGETARHIQGSPTALFFKEGRMSIGSTASGGTYILEGESNPQNVVTITNENNWANVSRPADSCFSWKIVPEKSDFNHPNSSYFKFSTPPGKSFYLRTGVATLEFLVETIPEQ